MADQNIQHIQHTQHQNQDLNLVLSSDAKPRLKWTPELHQRFVDAVAQLGGPETTPKSLMRVMSIHGLTLYHLKSHLQKFRLGKIQQSPACSESKQEEFVDDHKSDVTSMDHNDETPNQNNESLKIAQALQMQMEVQRTLHEQIEVQRHLQLRIEAQGKYLQSVLKKAQDTLAGYNSSTIEVEVAKAELSQLVSMVDNGCPSSLSVLTELENSSLKMDTETNPKTKSSLESSLTSSESSGRNEKDNLVLSLMDVKPENQSENSNFGSGRKRSGSTISDGNCQVSKSKRFDLNSEYVNDVDFDFESRSYTLDLNSK
ncbi:myb family transcription factor PHL8 isoform X2 [Helianthus annuus]|uniref:myb family transcription factor PHL8 isoform X2 n=1 Tax=Helianthus annuus TaxID=4232 RepID=UPI000B9095FE|nr:myb family transcription factor PHL8 isoform X2 [Helianthus annuus]